MDGRANTFVEYRKYLPDLDGDNSDAGQWLSGIPDWLSRLSSLIDDDLTKRTSNLSELVRFPTDSLEIIH